MKTDGEALLAAASERRVAACVQACEGIPTELLEGGIILKLIAACVHSPDGRIREVLEELVRHRLSQEERGTADGRGSARRPSGFSSIRDFRPGRTRPPNF